MGSKVDERIYKLWKWEMNRKDEKKIENKRKEKERKQKEKIQNQK